MRLRATAFAATALLSSTALMGTAWAGAGDDCCDDIEDLQRQILLLQAQIDELKNQSPEIDHEVNWKGAPRIEGKNNRFKVRGRIMVDFVHQDGDTGILFDPLTEVEPFVTGTEFRRARLGVEGRISKNTDYKFEVDFADNEVDITDAYLRQKVGPAKITVGQFKTPNSLEEQTSSRYTTFMERAQFTDAFNLSRQIGIGVGFEGEQWTLNVGGFGATADPDVPDDPLYEESWTVAARGTFAPINEDGRVVHVGGSVRWTDYQDLTDIRYRQRPGVHQSERFVVNDFRAGRTPGVEGVEGDFFWGVEAAGGFGPFHVQGEYAQQTADLITDPLVFLATADDDPTFKGWYVEAGFFLTGESRPYDGGDFGRVKVDNPVNDGGWGAWQIAVRYDQLDLKGEDTDGDLSPDYGGEQNIITAGINWHLNDYTRFMFNYARADVEESLEVFEVLGDPNGDTKINSFGLRGQIDW